MEFAINFDEEGPVFALAQGKWQFDFEKVVAFTIRGEEVILDPEAVDVDIGGIFRDLDPVACAGDKLKGGVLKTLEKLFIDLQTVALAPSDDGWGEAPFIVSNRGIPSIKAGGEINSPALVNSSGKSCGKDKVDLSVSTVVATVQSELFGLEALEFAQFELVLSPEDFGKVTTFPVPAEADQSCGEGCPCGPDEAVFFRGNCIHAGPKNEWSG